ncbi:MAG TPA: isoprenylcysteine carboxylmethyltransferase family protein [Lacipirellulaceae bacterium]|nr:isoprenylcysteine carboxylmethyltransferase family protein [Lacipirellulaceae bacterium]
MALAEEMKAQGEWLFRWRSYLPLILLPLIGIALAKADLRSPGRLDESWDYFCLGLSFVGLVVRVLTIGYVPQQTSGRNTTELVADELNTTGMYSIVRHPLYLGNYLIGLGVSMVQFVWWVPVIYSLAFWLYYERIMLTEEAFLEKRFGDEYRRWAAKTPAFLPRFRQWRRAVLPFSLLHVLRREHTGLMVVILCHTGQEFVERLITDHRVVWEAFWATLLFSGLAMYLSLRWLTRKTTLLHVPGR